MIEETKETSGPAAPLKNVRVIDMGQYIAGPGAAMVLAELGAQVTKIEPLAGDQARHIGRYGESMIRATAAASNRLRSTSKARPGAGSRGA
jgi:crotonobetainyl-CoA:carnitine CoA-transferase CaiB-like acyl-CoA transferase